MVYDPHYFQLRETQLKRMLAIVEQTKDAQPGGVVFFGDSLTEIYPLEESYSELPLKYNCGIGGATSKLLLNMLDEGVIKYQPKLVVLMVGINDLGNTVMLSPREIAVNIARVIDVIRGNCPDAKVLLWSTLPCVEALRDYHHVAGIRCNDFSKMIFELCHETVRDPLTTFVDVFPQFVAADGEALTEFYQDGLHLNEKGFERLTALLKPEILKLLGE